MDDVPTVFITHLYDDGLDDPQPWSRPRRSADERPWTATAGGTTLVSEEASFDSVEEAIVWGRERAKLVLVRLGSSVEASYSAGSRHATSMLDGSG
jgi:hypothetical protein